MISQWWGCYCDNNISSLLEKYGLRGSTNIHNASFTTVAKMHLAIDLCDNRKSIGRFVRLYRKVNGHWDVLNGKCPTVIMQTDVCRKQIS